MQLPSSKRAVFESDTIEVYTNLPQVGPEETPPYALAVVGTLPDFSLDTENDPTPATEIEAEAWIRAICNKPRHWLPLFLRASTATHVDLVRSQFTKMYGIYTKTDARTFLDTHFRRPDAPAGIKAFPLRIEVTAFLMCAGAAALGLLALILSR